MSGRSIDIADSQQEEWVNGGRKVALSHEMAQWMWYKSLRLYQIKMNGLFEFSDTQTRGNSKKLKKPRVLKTFRLNSFCVRTTNKWNSLPNDIVNSKTVLSFKTLYGRYMGVNTYITEKIYSRDLLANLLVSTNIAYWTSTVRLYMYDNITTAFLRRTTTWRKLYIFTKASCPLDWKKNMG